MDDDTLLDATSVLLVRLDRTNELLWLIHQALVSMIDVVSELLEPGSQRHLPHHSDEETNP